MTNFLAKPLNLPRTATEAQREKTQLVAMLGTMPSRAGSAIDARATLAAFEDVLAEFPHEAVTNAIRGYRSGKFGDGRFAPTPAEIAKVIREEQAADRERVNRLADQQRLDRETLAERGRRAHAEQPVEERAKVVTECLRSIPSASTGKITPLEWVDEFAGKPPRPVTKFSDKLVAQLAGEVEIGEGKLGLSPLMTPEQRKAYDDARFADMDAFAQETIG
jgi:hypothetical protein